MKDIIKLLRVKHYIKNVLIFLPLFFGGAIFSYDKLLRCSMGVVSFCLVSSAVYILNDYKDIEKDRNHPTKKNRPLASGRIKPSSAMIIFVLCLIVVLILALVIKDIRAAICLFVYLGLNVAYSMGLKNKPIIDIVILASGFVIRVIYGGFVSDIVISKWLYLVVTTGSIFMGLGKRRNELKAQTDTRTVLKYYNEGFLDKNMYVCVALADVFYSLWTLEMSNPYVSWTVPVFIVLLMCYSLDAEGDSDGDPVEVILKDKVLIVLGIGYAFCLFVMLYF